MSRGNRQKGLTMNTDGPPVDLGSTEVLGMPVAAYEAGSGVQIVACRQLDGSRLWAVRDRLGDVLNKRGYWEIEPLPSSRDKAFLERCRYATPLEARDAYMRSLHA